MHLFRAVVFVAIALSAAARGAAQNDVVARARTAAASGQRAEALTMLERHLADSPRDVDARLAYGLILSWDGRYDDARAALKQALAQAPTYNDARVALMNVEYWSGQSAQARQLADQILSADPDNTTARAVRDRLAAAARAWQAITTYTVDSFSGDRAAWQEASLSLTRKTKVGSAIVRATQADRYDETDQLFEAEFYPRFRPGTYAFVSAGISAKATLYPEFRLAGDLYQSLGHGYELSVGGRYLHFTSPTTIYVGTLSKYIGNWMLTGKTYVVPAGDFTSTSYYGGFRRYFGGDGTSYWGASYGHGFSREEVHDIADLTTLASDSVRGEVDAVVGARLRLFASGGTARQEQTTPSALWQTTFSGGVTVLF